MDTPPKRLSIIVPCYNVEKYVCTCLDSLYNQDISEDDYEVICVNDCSQDRTRDIILHYQELHSNLFLIDHERNKRLGESRNTGLHNANGKYIWFIDSDDFIESNILNDILNIIESHDLDILNFDINIYHADGTINPQTIAGDTKITTGAEWLKNLEKNFDENASVCRKIYRKMLLLNNNVHFPDRIYEDQYFNLVTIYKAKRFKYINKHIYYYRNNPNSILNKPFKQVYFISSLESGADYLNFYHEIKNSDFVFAEKVKMSALWKINFGCKELPYYSMKLRKRMIKSLQPHLSVLQQTNYFKGFIQQYFQHFHFYNEFFFVFSPLLRSARHIKRYIKLIRKRLLKYNITLLFMHHD
jgi:glycosyltransferase involved in cell wall biosynthesis